MPNTLWLIDRSRVADGRGFCQRYRYLNSHSGSHGYGIQLKGTKLPLVTGTAAHEGLRPILEWCRDFYQDQQAFLDQYQQTGQVVPHMVVRSAVQHAQAEYFLTIAARGFAYMQDQEGITEQVREQNYLIEGVIWAWVLEVLPEVLSRGRVLEVEHDEVYVFGCTCGLGDGVLGQVEHESRECSGIGWMCKPDFILETWETKELEYHEFKTTSSDGPSFRDKWEIMIQMFAATLDVERRYGKPVGSVYVHGLIKGRRGGDYNPDNGKYDLGADKQSSIFCYGYRKPANPPMEREEWAAQYEWRDEQGGRRRLGKAYQKTGVWELPDQLLDPAAGITSKAEFWAKWIPSEVRRKQLVLLGPFTRQERAVPGFIEECKGEEDRWRNGLWQLYELVQVIVAEHPDPPEGVDVWWAYCWPDPRFQSLLNSLFPRSYECRRYGRNMACTMEAICFEREGWADPLGTGRFILRRPHHAAELQQAIDRGCLLPEVGSGEEAEAE